jgi:hypothetical protein
MASASLRSRPVTVGTLTVAPGGPDETYSTISACFSTLVPAAGSVRVAESDAIDSDGSFVVFARSPAASRISSAAVRGARRTSGTDTVIARSSAHAPRAVVTALPGREPRNGGETQDGQVCGHPRAGLPLALGAQRIGGSSNRIQ